MPTCYGLLVSIASALDPQTRTWNVLGLVEGIYTRQVPVELPLHTHTFWWFTPEEIGKPFEVRIVLSFNAADLEPSEPLAFDSMTPYTHLRLQGLAFEQAGQYRVHMEWRRAGSKVWTREKVFWPCTVSLEKPT